MLIKAGEIWKQRYNHTMLRFFITDLIFFQVYCSVQQQQILLSYAFPFRVHNYTIRDMDNWIKIS